MDAREYLARKGLDGSRDEERPTTLGEKAWSRAREAGDHRPRAGTPHDWEDWERHHQELAAGAETLQQKIDREAHRRLLEHGADERRGPAALGRFMPGQAEAPARVAVMTTEVRLALLALAVLLPPLAVGLAGQPAQRVGVNLLLTLLGWVPGVVHALGCVRRRAGGFA
ncbi:YqaE/Pmp3 family membrane protein [Halomonas sp. BM-2019]|uniref:YqaE/Pmp3 family membrane protein n=1 Tax=Halomonas sp. BM-2019 TaxID=2811227 RepID=UPI001B3C3FA5|nr:MAG: YqaE/Pmp3 family membrane protein [Halomonas sp. BM-2019]